MKKTNDGAAQWWSEDKGFYMILLLCVAAVAVAAYVLFVSPDTVETDPLDGYVYEADDSVTASDTLDRVPAMDTSGDTAQEDTDEAEQTLAAADAGDGDEAAPAEKQTADTAAQLTFTPPTDGEISRAFSGDTLEYDETTRDWRTHTGTDYAGEEGDAVCAIADGTVIETGEDAIYGKYVTISHADGLESKYAGLDDISVSEGDSIAGGTQIAVLGSEPMPLEEAQGTHLHLEVTKEGEAINAADLF